MFIKVDRGWVNSAHVATVEQDFGSDGQAMTFFAASGDRLGQRTRSADDDWIGVAIVPAAAGTVGVVFMVDRGGDSPPSEVWVQRVPIVAWRVMNEREASPVLPIEHDPDAVMIEMPDGRLEWPYTATFDTVDDAKAEFLSQAVAVWNADQRRAAAKTAQAEAS